MTISPLGSVAVKCAMTSCDHMHRYKEDFALMRLLGIKNFRILTQSGRLLSVVLQRQPCGQSTDFLPQQWGLPSGGKGFLDTAIAPLGAISQLERGCLQIG